MAGLSVGLLKKPGGWYISVSVTSPRVVASAVEISPSVPLLLGCSTSVE